MERIDIDLDEGVAEALIDMVAEIVMPTLDEASAEVLQEGIDSGDFDEFQHSVGASLVNAVVIKAIERQLAKEDTAARAST